MKFAPWEVHFFVTAGMNRFFCTITVQIPTMPPVVSGDSSVYKNPVALTSLYLWLLLSFTRKTNGWFLANLYNIFNFLSLCVDISR